MKTKKLKLTLGLFMASFGFIQAQNGLENIVVEKYYVANAADAAASIGTLPVGSVTYRVYADMLPGYKLQMAYGNGSHPLQITTSTSFFNNEDRGNTVPNGITVNNTKLNTVALDSWFSVGASAVGKMGVLKSEDSDGTIFTSSTVLVNNGPGAGPLSGAGAVDGNVAGSPQAVTFVGFDPTSGVFDATSQFGNSFTTNNGAWSSLSGSIGATAANRVLLGQFTTDGVFGFQLNIQIGTPSGGTEQYVSSNPTGSEITISSLTLAPNNPPTVSLTAPTNGANVITGDVVAITATAADTDGSITSVEFFVDGVSVGVDNAAPFAANYTSVTGSHTITAKATDDDGDFTTSASRTISVNPNQAPTVSVSAATTAVVGDVVAITATVADVDGTVASVQFFVDGVSIGTDAVAPFTMNWTATTGTHNFTAKATDDRGAFTTSAATSISVANNIPPSVSLTAPASNATYTAPAVVNITATSTDVDGTVTQVEFFVNNVSVGVDATAPYSVSWTSVIGAADFTAVATDNKGATTTSAMVKLSIADPNALPYKVVTTTATCLPTSVCLPIAAVDTVRNVLGYDLVVNYDKTKLTPTGVITMENALITPSYVDVINSIDAVNGKITISAFINGTAPANAFFQGVGNLFCVEFTKTGSFQSVDTAIVSVSSLEESYIIGVSTKLVQAGQYITYKDNQFHGKLNFWSNSSPIKYNAANPNDYLITNIYGNNNTCSSKGAVAVQPNTSGEFTYNINNGLSINIEKDIIGTTDVMPVVNGADALLARKVLLNDLSFTPTIYQLIAMDVNEDGIVSAGDVTQINQRTVLLIPEFKQAWNYNNLGVKIVAQPSKDWIFVDSMKVVNNVAYHISATYPANDGVGYSRTRVPMVPFCLPVPVSNYPNCPLITTESYKGVLIGDVNGNFVTTTPNSAFKQSAENTVVFDLSKAVISNGYMDVPVSVSTVNAVTALDFSMQFNNNLTFSSVVNHATYLESLSSLNSDDQTLRFTSNSFQTYDMNKSLVSVRFAVQAGHTVTESDLYALSAYVNGDSAKVQLNSAAIGVAENSINHIINVYPNPASSGLLNVMVSTKATVELFDAHGRLVVTESVNANEKQEINVENLADGVYSIKISNDEFVSVRKVVISK